MRLSNAARVGIVVVLAGLLLAAATFWLRGTLPLRGTYLAPVAFTNAQGIQEGAYVRVRGVDMGSVESVSLDPQGQAVVTLRMRTPENGGYQVTPQDSIRIVGGLIGFAPPSVEITPGGRQSAAGRTDVLTGESGAGTDQLVAQGQELMGNLSQLSRRMTRLADSLTRFTEDPALRRDLRRTASNFANASERGVTVAENMQRATARADRMIAGFQKTTARLDATLDQVNRLAGSFQGTADQSREVMVDARRLMRDAGGAVREVQGAVKGLQDVARSTNATVQNTGELVTETRATLTENRERLTTLFSSLDRSLKQLDATLAEAKGFVGDPQLRNDLRATAENVRVATENLKKVSADVESITGDPKVQEDLRASISGLREVTEEATAVLRRARGVLGTGESTVRTTGQRLRETDLTLDLVHGTRSDRTRFDFGATIPWSPTTSFHLGLYDFGERNRLNLQAGQRIRHGVWARYGFRASRLGVGLDLGRRGRPGFQVDIFGVRRPQVDVRGNIPIASFLDLTLGLDSVQRRPDPLIGLRFRRSH